MNANRRLRRRRLAAAACFALLAFAIGAVIATSGGASPGRTLAERFVSDWAKGDYGRMYSALSTSSRGSLTQDAWAQTLASSLRTATAASETRVGRARSLGGGEFSVPVRVRTRLFGTLSLPYRLRVSESGGAARVRFEASLEFPGLRAGELLTRHTYLPRRATLLARDGSVLAETPAAGAGQAPARVSPLGSLASSLLGSDGPVPTARRAALEAQGVPPQGPVGLDGIEFALDARLRGTPGGQLLAGARVLASVAAHAAPAVRTSVLPTVQQAAVEALGGQYGGIVALVPSSGEILAVAGIGLDGRQPPGSTFKMVTTAGVLSAHLAGAGTVFPYATHAVLDGVSLGNAHGEDCGGTLELSFAVSCNSVFAPLGVKLGATRLVAMAEALGFNHPPGVEGASESTLPRAREIEGELALGSTAIGQGKVQATALQMATVASAIADGGVRPQPGFLALGPVSHPAGPRAMSHAVAVQLRRFMEAVVREGTGTSAAIPGVTVAGKTGTAELGGPCSAAEQASPSSETKPPSEASGCKSPEAEAHSTDAWFAAFAPALSPRIAVGVLLVEDGAGGTTAAPVARAVLEAALRAGI